ncbi:GumC domain-containing protein [Cellulomonas gilvus]|uniref:Lipopolysaccharide biosynthesis protein n=1 Tax=Cellulomonas gilvus (strain ATCC 13127 / NRRL B-14078) TaxID=593907 RepID=F8A6S3_CELGA|nr:lipopolysaccharide biosynthesis protein [Cellulomonas gilvus]AEI11133.1 lipopolysaccharide biosynthesis protein [Cellulomonas gilvus ATCC 13127]
MALTLDERPTAPRPLAAPDPDARGTTAWRTWPLTVLVLAFPVWWILGLSAFVPILATVPMAVDLVRHGSVRLPRGALWWGLFVVWLLASGLMLWVDAPGAVPGGGGGRLMVYGYRVAWYLACTVVLLWLGNADERQVRTDVVLRLLGWMFVWTVLGGLLGTFLPRFEVTSAVELALPGGLRSNGFVQSLVHPQASTMTTFLGHVEYRPNAPFSFANSWGANLSLYLPFFLLGWCRRGAGWRRVVAPVVLVLAALPVVYSMNRGLWLALGAGAAFVVVRWALRGNLAHVVALATALVVAALVLWASPLADVVSERLANAHSNDRRSELLERTVTSTLEGSPVVGFGSTRDVQGSFASIAGGSTPDCPACGVPPLGTQGHLWGVIFTTGVVGAAFFLLFFVRRAWAHWRCRTPVETLAAVILLFFAIELFVYDTLGLPLMTVMAALALAWRERDDDGTDLAHVRARLRHAAPLVVALTVAGAGVGMVVAAQQPEVYAARTSLLLARPPVALDPDSGTERKNQEITVDTEAALVVSAGTLDRIDRTISGQAALRDAITITAAPNTDVLTIEYRSTDADRASAVADELAAGYLDSRADYLALRREQVLASLDTALRNAIELDTAGDSSRPLLTEERVQRYIDNVLLATTEAGEVVRSARSVRLPDEAAVPVVSGALLGLLSALALDALLSVVHRRPSGLPPVASPTPARSRP